MINIQTGEEKLSGDDPFCLQRFVDAQASVYEAVVRELKTGRKRTHWMWFVFPQISGLGRSATAKRYAISGLEEARAYLEHPILGKRLEACTGLVMQLEGRPLSRIFGYPDDLKFCSSMTLFAEAGASDSLFYCAIHKYCNGVPDPATLDRL